MFVADNEHVEDITGYKQLVGVFQYCTLTRLEIAYSVNQLCQHLHSPTIFHWKSTKRVLCYLKGLVDPGLYFSKGSLSLHAYYNSNWAGDHRDKQIGRASCRERV